MSLIMEKLKRFSSRWRLFFIYCAFLYLSLPFAPIWWGKITAKLGRFGSNLPFVLLVIFGLVVFFIRLRKKPARSGEVDVCRRDGIISLFLYLKRGHKLFGSVLLLFILAGLFIVLSNTEFVAEKIHVIEYAILSFIIYHCIGKGESKGRIYFRILLIGFSVGLVDEMIQYILPNRVFDIKDIFLNFSSASLGLSAVFALNEL